MENQAPPKNHFKSVYSHFTIFYSKIVNSWTHNWESTFTLDAMIFFKKPFVLSYFQFSQVFFHHLLALADVFEGDGSVNYSSNREKRARLKCERGCLKAARFAFDCMCLVQWPRLSLWGLLFPRTIIVPNANNDRYYTFNHKHTRHNAFSNKSFSPPFKW